MKAPNEIWRHKFFSPKYGVEGVAWNDVKIDDTDIRFINAGDAEKELIEKLDIVEKTYDEIRQKERADDTALIRELAKALNLTHWNYEHTEYNNNLITRANERLKGVKGEDDDMVCDRPDWLGDLT